MKSGGQDTAQTKEYREQFENSISDLSSDNHLRRYNAINRLRNNPALDESDFELLETILAKEFEYPGNAFIDQNTDAIINALFGINIDKTMEALRGLWRRVTVDNITVNRYRNLFHYIVSDNSPETTAVIREKLKDGSQQALLSLLAMADATGDHIPFILTECESLAAIYLLETLKPERPLNFLSKRKEVDAMLMGWVICIPDLDRAEIEAFLLKFYKKQPEEHKDCLLPIIVEISESKGKDTELKTRFLALVKETGCEEEICLLLDDNPVFKPLLRELYRVYYTAAYKHKQRAISSITTIENDFTNFRVQIHGVWFSGTQLDMLALDGEYTDEQLDGFSFLELAEGESPFQKTRCILWDCTFGIIIPQRILDKCGNTVLEVPMRLQICLGRNEEGGANTEETRASLDIGGKEYSGEGGQIDAALDQVREQFKGEYAVKNCYGCQYGNYHPTILGLLGTMVPFYRYPPPPK